MKTKRDLINQIKFLCNSHKSCGADIDYYDQLSCQDLEFTLTFLKGYYNGQTTELTTQEDKKQCNKRRYRLKQTDAMTKVVSNYTQDHGGLNTLEDALLDMIDENEKRFLISQVVKCDMESIDANIIRRWDVQHAKFNRETNQNIDFAEFMAIVNRQQKSKIA
jgi:hypothetical protein